MVRQSPLDIFILKRQPGEGTVDIIPPRRQPIEVQATSRKGVPLISQTTKRRKKGKPFTGLPKGQSSRFFKGVTIKGKPAKFRNIF